MKKVMLLLSLFAAIQIYAQSIFVGDSVVINSSAKRWMTGEVISSWVYFQPHIVTQVGSDYHPSGLLLDVRGVKSWIKEEDVSKISNDNVTFIPDTIIKYDTIVSIQKQEYVVYIHDTVTKVEEMPHEDITLYQGAYDIRFQMYGNFNQYFGPQNYGAGIDLIVGARLTDFAYIGGGVELDYMTAGKVASRSIQFPVFVHAKVFVPVDYQYFPHIEMSLGANMGYRTYSMETDLRPTGFHYGLYARGGIGIDLLKNLSLGVGYQYAGGFSNVPQDLHHAYIRIGFVIPE